MSTEDELNEIRRQKREELLAQLDGDGPAGTGATGDDTAATDAPSEPIHVDGTDHLQELVGRYDVVLVDFYADWCGPCQMIEPMVRRLAAETDAAVAKVDIDAHQDLAAQQGVQGVPTLQLYADGDLVERLVGAQGESQLRRLVEQYT